MYYWIAANLVVLLHLIFILFVIGGGLLSLKWRWMPALHIPALVWGALIEFQGWICPLTPLEIRFLQAAGQTGYSGGFLEQYLLPILYPASLNREIQLTLGVFVVLVNIVVYAFVLRRRSGYRHRH